MEKTYGLVLSPDGLAEFVEFPTENKLDWYYKKLDCDCIDIVNPYGLEDIAKTYNLESLMGKFCLVVDDEGLLKGEPQVNLIASLLYGADSHKQCLFGKVLVAANERTPDGIDTVGFSEGEIGLVQVVINSLIDHHNEKVRGANG